MYVCASVCVYVCLSGPGFGSGFRLTNMFDSKQIHDISLRVVLLQVPLPFRFAPYENGDSLGELKLTDSPNFDFSKLLPTDIFSYSWSWYDV